MKIDFDLVPETLEWCHEHYVPTIQNYVYCGDFGKCDGMDGSCWWCKEMTPYQWHMCADSSSVRSLMGPLSKIKAKTIEEAATFIEEYKQRQ